MTKDSQTKAGDHSPIGYVQCHGERVSEREPDEARELNHENSRPDREEQEQGWQKAKRTPNVECLKRYAARDRSLLEEKRRNQKAAQREEHVDAQPSTRQ